MTKLLSFYPPSSHKPEFTDFLCSIITINPHYRKQFAIFQFPWYLHTSQNLLPPNPLNPSFLIPDRNHISSLNFCIIRLRQTPAKDRPIRSIQTYTMSVPLLFRKVSEDCSSHPNKELAVGSTIDDFEFEAGAVGKRLAGEDRVEAAEGGLYGEGQVVDEDDGGAVGLVDGEVWVFIWDMLWFWQGTLLFIMLPNPFMYPNQKPHNTLAPLRHNLPNRLPIRPQLPFFNRPHQPRHIPTRHHQMPLLPFNRPHHLLNLSLRHQPSPTLQDIHLVTHLDRLKFLSNNTNLFFNFLK